MQLTELTDIWRFVGTYDGGKEIKAVYTRVPCLRVPLSKFDKLASALSASTHDTSPSEYFRSQGRQSTDVFLIPTWIATQTDDELRRGRRKDVTGAIVPLRFTVAGVQTFETFGYEPDLQAVFCEQLQ